MPGTLATKTGNHKKSMIITLLVFPKLKVFKQMCVNLCTVYRKIKYVHTCSYIVPLHGMVPHYWMLNPSECRPINVMISLLKTTHLKKYCQQMSSSCMSCASLSCTSNLSNLPSGNIAGWIIHHFNSCFPDLVGA